MKVDLATLYYEMARMRVFEEAVAQLWEKGLISGEMHLGTGEEAVVAGIAAHLLDGDAVALDHRATPALVARRVPLRALLLEMLGSEEGLCKGRGGHMHLLAPEHLAAASGIVGSAGPLACGFALAAQHLRPNRVAVAFFGEGAANQGMLMESFNLAAAWHLPVVFVCKDNGWSVSTHSRDVTGGSLLARAASFGLEARAVNGCDVAAVWKVAGRAVSRARGKGRPQFVLARCHHPEGHLLGDPLPALFRNPTAQSRETGMPLLAAALGGSTASWGERIRGVAYFGRTLFGAGVELYASRDDPLERARRRLPAETAQKAEALARAEVDEAVAATLETMEASSRA